MSPGSCAIRGTTTQCTTTAPPERTSPVTRTLTPRIRRIPLACLLTRLPRREHGRQGRRTSVCGVGPAAADSDGDVQRDVQRVSVAHFTTYEFFDGIPLTGCDLQDQLVVHLQQQPR